MRAVRRKRGRTSFSFSAVKLQDMRYGENPHQSAAFYRDETPAPGSIATYRQLQGKELSYNNVADSDAAWECVKTFAEPACVIVKHANPVRRRTLRTPLDAYRKAFATDPTSAFGGIIAFNRPVDASTGRGVAAQFLEVLIAPSYTTTRSRQSQEEANVRVLEIPSHAHAQPNAWDMKRVGGGVLVQSPDDANVRESDLKVVTKRAPTRASARPHVRVARRQVREVQRDRLRQGRADARRRRGPDVARGSARIAAIKARTRASRSRARRSRPTPSSRSATGSTSSPTTAPPRSSSRAAACATRGDRRGGRARPRNGRSPASATSVLTLMNILVIGGGGREHALAWKIAQSPRVARVYVAPGNAGTARDERSSTCRSRTSPSSSPSRGARRSRSRSSARGAARGGRRRRVSRSRPCDLRPTRAAAQLESSKDFAKAFMQRHGLPTAAYETFTDARAAHATSPARCAHRRQGRRPRGGKGVVVAQTAPKPMRAIDAMLVDNAMGSRGRARGHRGLPRGEEASFIVMVDGRTCCRSPRRRTTSAAGRRRGPNTGGMGAYSPRRSSRRAARAHHARDHHARRQRHGGGRHAVQRLPLRRRDDRRAGHPKVLEFNCRMGDPETQPIMARLKSDLVDARAARGRRNARHDRSRVGPQGRARRRAGRAGYPEAPSKGATIAASIASPTRRIPACTCSRRAPRCTDGRVVVSGGRVLCVTALGDSVRQAQRAAYAAVGDIRFDGMQYRTDIGHRAVSPRKP
jgi:phosphoribosylamine--glycine ligase